MNIHYLKGVVTQVGPGRKNIDAKTYHQATGFESLIGGLYLEDKKRCDDLIDKAIILVESGGLNG